MRPIPTDFDYIFIIILICIIILMIFIYILIELINAIQGNKCYNRGYSKGFEDGKLQKLVEFEDGTGQYCNPANLGDIKYTIVEK